MTKILGKKNLTYWVWRRLPWLVIRWSNVTLRRKFLVHLVVHTLIFGFEDFKKIQVSILFHLFSFFFKLIFCFEKFCSLAENQTIVRTMFRIPNVCPKTKRLFFCLSIFQSLKLIKPFKLNYIHLFQPLLNDFYWHVELSFTCLDWKRRNVFGQHFKVPISLTLSSGLVVRRECIKSKTYTFFCDC